MIKNFVRCDKGKSPVAYNLSKKKKKEAYCNKFIL